MKNSPLSKSNLILWLNSFKNKMREKRKRNEELLLRMKILILIIGSMTNTKLKTINMENRFKNSESRFQKNSKIWLITNTDVLLHKKLLVIKTIYSIIKTTEHLFSLLTNLENPYYRWAQIKGLFTIDNASKKINKW